MGVCEAFMKKWMIVFGVIIALLLFKLLSSDGGLAEYAHLKQQLQQLEAENQAQRKLNEQLKQRVHALQTDPKAIETLARQKLGMIGKDEVFIQIIEPSPSRLHSNEESMPETSTNNVNPH
jgi:cell division protein FtsB